MELGIGVDLISGRARAQAVNYEKSSTILQDLSAWSLTVLKHNHVATSQRELEEYLDVSAAMSLGFGFGALSANAHFAKRIAMSKTLCLVVKVTAIARDEPIQKPKLLPEALETYKRNPKNFLTQYGDRYVHGYIRGGVFYGPIVVAFLFYLLSLARQPKSN